MYASGYIAIYMHNYTKNFTLLSNNTHKLYSHLLYIQFALKTKQNYLQPYWL